MSAAVCRCAGLARRVASVLLLLSAAALVGVPAQADSGRPIASGDSGDLHWTLYVESPGAVVGEGELGVLFVRAQGGVVVPARVAGTVRGPDGSVQRRAARPGFADNYLIHGLPVFFHQPGPWQIVIEGEREPGGTALRIEHTLQVAEGPGVWWRSWPALLFPALVVMLAVLARRRAQST